MDKTIAFILGGTVLLLGIFLFIGHRQEQQVASMLTADDATIISQSGVHEHVHLTIIIDGRQQSIPANIGIGPLYATSRWYNSLGGMADMHTHDDTGTLHWEIASGPVRTGQLRLGTFFEVWGKPFNDHQILDKTNNATGKVVMTINGQPNTAYDRYIIHDQDKIEIRFG